MSTAQDVALTIAKETTYGTPVTVTRSLEFLSESLNFRKKVNEASAYHYGSRLASSAGRTLMTTDAGGDVKFELRTKGQGLLWQACLGEVTNTVTADADTYQQVHTIGDPLPSLTVQKVLPALDTDGSFVDTPYTFDGVLVSKWTLEVPQAAPASLSLTFDARDVKTATAAVTPSYPSGDHLLHFGGACLYTGALTAPTTTALATATTPVANAKSITISGDNALGSDKSYYFCGNGKKSRPFRGRTKVSGSLTVEFIAGGPFVTAFLADSAMTLLLTLTSLEDADEKVQVALTDLRIEGDLPQAGGDPGIIELKVPFTAYASAADENPLYVVVRTHDTTV